MKNQIPKGQGKLKHCWGKKRRQSKKMNKAVWKILCKEGVITKARAKHYSWDDFGLPHFKWQKQDVPALYDMSADYWGEADETPIVAIAFYEVEEFDFDCDENGGFVIAKRKTHIASDLHLLRLLRAKFKKD